MIRFIIIIGVLSLLTSCSTTIPITERTKFPLFVKGTYAEGSNITEPRPRVSEYFQVDHAGFVVLEKGVAYYLQALVRQSPKSNYYIRVEYENPQDKEHPFENDMELKPDMKGVRFSSPDVVSGIRNYQNYTIQVTVYASRESTIPIDTLVQPVRAYVDSTKHPVRIYNRIRE